MDSEINTLLFDIETGPNIGYTWGKYEQNVIEFLQEWSLLCFSYKWLGDDTTYCIRVDKYGDDLELTKVLHALFEEADIIIAHNGDSFDIKKVNARFIFHGMTPPSPYHTVDTKKVAKASFRFNTNKLDDIGNLLGLGRKMDTGGFDLWLGCMKGDRKSWDLMMDYNIQDVDLLEDIYLKLLPWMKNHPIRKLVSRGTLSCKNCESSRMGPQGTKQSRQGLRQQWKCRDCGAWDTTAA